MYVAFDIGNVLCHCDMDKYIRTLTQLTKCGFNFDNEIKVSKFLETMEKLDYLGIINRVKYLNDNMKFYFTHESSEEYLNDLWNSIVYPNEQMINFMTKLKDAGVKIALLSNMGPDHAKYLRGKYPELFDKTIQHLSFEVGAFKPSKLFYQSFLMSNEEFAGCLYLDDVNENIIAGSKMKFDAIHFDLRDFKKPIDLKKRLDVIYDKITTGI